MRKYRIKAFTLLELIIALVLSGILISTISLAYLKFQRTFLQIRQLNSDTRTFSRFYDRFYRDFNQARFISYSNYYKTLYLDIDGEEVEYRLFTHAIERQQGEEEHTWPLQVERREVEYLEDTDLVKLISCDIFNQNNQGYKIYWTKEYPSKILFENELNH